MTVLELLKIGKDPVNFALELTETETQNSVSVNVAVFGGSYDTILRSLTTAVRQGLAQMGITEETIDGQRAEG